MALEWLEFAFIGNKRKFTSTSRRPAVKRLKANIPICHASQFNDCKLRNQGTNLCNQYDAQHSLTIVISSLETLEGALFKRKGAYSKS